MHEETVDLCSSICLMTISVKATTYKVAKHDLGL